jgi:hypothetical protein
MPIQHPSYGQEHDKRPACTHRWSEEDESCESSEWANQDEGNADKQGQKSNPHDKFEKTGSMMFLSVDPNVCRLSVSTLLPVSHGVLRKHIGH